LVGIDARYGSSMYEFDMGGDGAARIGVPYADSGIGGGMEEATYVVAATGYAYVTPFG
jgi:hypothetical protein